MPSVASLSNQSTVYVVPAGARVVSSSPQFLSSRAIQAQSPTPSQPQPRTKIYIFRSPQNTFAQDLGNFLGKVANATFSVATLAVVCKVLFGGRNVKERMVNIGSTAREAVSPIANAFKGLTTVRQRPQFA